MSQRAKALRAVWLSYADAVASQGRFSERANGLALALELLGESLAQPQCTCGTGNHVHMDHCLKLCRDAEGREP